MTVSDPTGIAPAMLDRLAEVAVRVGLNLQSGQDLVLTAPVAALPLVRRVAAAAYRAGAGLVTPILADEEVALARYRNAGDDSFDRAPGWLYRGMAEAYGSNAARMALQGNVIDATEAARIGLVHQMVADAAALEAAVASVIEDCRQGAPRALAETKKLIAALGPLSPDGYAEAGALAFARCASGDEAREGIAAFKEKRPPVWAS